MNYEEVNYIPKGLKVIKNERDEAILKYRSTNQFIFLMSLIIYNILVIAVLLSFMFNQFIDFNGTVTVVLVTLFVISIVWSLVTNNIWTTITIKPEYVSVKEKKFKIEHTLLRSSGTNNDSHNMYLDYGETTHKLPSSKKSGAKIVNYINPIIISIGTEDSVQDAFEKGEREQRF